MGCAVGPGRSTRLVEAVPSVELRLGDGGCVAPAAGAAVQAVAGHERREALWLPFGATVERTIDLPRGSELRAGLAAASPGRARLGVWAAGGAPGGAPPRPAGAGGGAGGPPPTPGRVRLVVSAALEAPWPWQGAAEAQGSVELAADEWTELRLALTGAAPGPSRLRLEVRAEGAGPACRAGVALGQPTLVARDARPGRPNLVLVSIDTLRADRVASGMPRLAAWARARATSFDQARAMAPWTLPSHASMLSGLSPLRHGANWSYVPLSAGVPLVTPRLREEGYATAALVGGGWLEPPWGLAKGFERHRSWGRAGRGAEEWTDHSARAVRWLGELPQPFFLFLHTLDVHNFPRGEALPAGPADARRRELYDQAVRHADEGLATILARLSEAPWRDDTAVILTADHGEALGEGGAYGHGTLQDEVLRVPLLLAEPGPRHVTHDVRSAQTADVAATLLDLAGLGPGPALDGRSLRSSAGPSTPALAYFPFVGQGHGKGQGLALVSGARLLRLDDSAFARVDEREGCFDAAGGTRRELPECAALRPAGRSRLLGAPPGWSLRLERGEGMELPLELRGRAVTPRFARGWSDEGPLLVATGPAAARVVWPSDGRLELTLAALPDLPLILACAGRELALQPRQTVAPARWGFSHGAWAPRESGPCPPGWLCAELAWQGQFPPPGEPPVDEAQHERLRALGYVN